MKKRIEGESEHGENNKFWEETCRLQKAVKELEKEVNNVKKIANYAYFL